jgi:hypothetical protein
MLWFADDKAVIAKNEEKLQRMLRCMELTLQNELNVKINTKKSKFMYVTRTIILGK